MDFKTVKNCRVCGSENLIKYLDLGNVPLCNALLDSPSEAKTYPVEVLLCGECSLSQLSIVVDPAILYEDYVYHSSVSNTFKKHCYDLAINLKKEFSYKDYPLVVDIASNDGCLLDQFKLAGFNRLMGVEPSENLIGGSFGDVGSYHDRGLISVNSFWSERLAKDIFGNDSGTTQGASFIIAQNVFGHVDDLNDFLKGVHHFLDNTGVFVMEVPYLFNLLKNNQFDTIYHEHLSYFLLKPLKRIFEANNLPIFRVEQTSIHGGSLRIYASRNCYQEEQSVLDMIHFEESENLYDIKTYELFAERVKELKNKFLITLELLFHGEQKVMAYGASAKGISLLNYSGISSKHIHSIVDDTPDKQGKFTPGSNIPIISYPHFFKEEPKFIVLLAWNFANELIAKTKWHQGKYIIPIPDVVVV